MVNFLVRLLLQNSGLIFQSVRSAYRTVVSRTQNNPKSSNSADNETNNSNTQDSSKQHENESNQNQDKDKGKESFGYFSMQNLISSPMTKEEAIKILDLKEVEQISPKDIMNQFNKLMKLNDLEKGGSFYIQNKIYNAKEYLMEQYPKEENVSEHNPKI